MVNITFWGVRGSTPCPCEANERYGGNTACVSLEAPGQDPILFDIGTGLRFFGESLPGDAPFHCLALVTHLVEPRREEQAQPEAHEDDVGDQHQVPGIDPARGERTDDGGRHPGDQRPPQHPTVDQSALAVALRRHERPRHGGGERRREGDDRWDAHGGQHRRGDGRAALAEQATEEPDAGADGHDQEEVLGHASTVHQIPGEVQDAVRMRPIR